ncbi:DUF4262 domain-containing protein [Amycolatopsis sp. CA-230715]|uniref:DUF4262 domain-containing protein n=1 Tax=Amycolatopsis sp. CA-230715 TaxID=2745196 RepID=UPI001C01CE05|nr:DUF4262 domain-containing protein [Amycolatopsis sp. CA-230715]QWF82367.1 hypothetical protein HUW46_05804 [Amycolatopsis sp. CA-230715]
MCWQCDNPGKSVGDYLDYIAGEITKYGWIVQSVEEDAVRASWAYTVGLTRTGRPELVVTGLPGEVSAGLLNEFASHLGHSDDTPVPGERITFENGGPSIELVELAEPSVHLLMAVGLYGKKIRGLQLVYADDEGRMPWERAYNDGQGGQPVLGSRATAPRGDDP